MKTIVKAATTSVFFVVVLVCVFVQPKAVFQNADIAKPVEQVPDQIQQAKTIEVTPVEEAKPTAPVIITSYKFNGPNLEYVQIFNYDADIVDLDAWQIIYTINTENGDLEIPISLTGYLPKKAYAVFATKAAAVSARDAEIVVPTDLPIDSRLKSLSLLPTKDREMYQHDKYAKIFTVDGRYDLIGRSATTEAPLKDSKYAKTTDNATLRGLGLYDYDEDTNLRISEILATTRDCDISETNLSDCYEFVEIYNSSGYRVDLSDYNLRIGWMNDASLSANNKIPLNGDIEPFSYVSISKNAESKPLAIVASSGGAWLEDKYSLHNYQETLVKYSDLDKEASKGRSWAIDVDGSWKMAMATPGKVNDFNIPEPETLACPQGQYRSEETGRCRKIETPSAPKPCKDGQYRSEETGRCRSILSEVTAQLKPCGDDEFRNPATGRCKKIASKEDILEPCKPGYERNPETNRCRKALSNNMPAADYPVVPFMSDEGSDNPILMGALAGGVVLAIGYGVWEWRKEIAGLPRKLLSLFAKTK